MSHKTGIKSNSELLNFFAKCKKKSSKIRLVKVSIINEELSLNGHKDTKKDWESDFDKCLDFIVENVPCYILYRLDDFNKTVDSYFWMLISWTPDSSTTREKMIYASTKSTLKQEFGTTNLKEEYLATSLDEMCLDGYKKNKVFQKASTPLTQREQEIIEMRRTEVKAYSMAPDPRKQAMSGLDCPISDAAERAIKDMIRGSYNYIQLMIDLEKEEINISKAENIEVTKLVSLIPTDHARFHVYLFKHYYEGDYQESFIFIYSMSSNCSVKEKMMYSSCKAQFLDKIQTSFGISLTKKLEIDDPTEVSEENLLEELYPKKMLHRAQFAKPAPPSKRGPRRLIK